MCSGLISRQSGEPDLVEGRSSYKHEGADVFIFYNAFLSAWCIGHELHNYISCLAMTPDDVCIFLRTCLDFSISSPPALPSGPDSRYDQVCVGGQQHKANPGEAARPQNTAWYANVNDRDNFSDQISFSQFGETAMCAIQVAHGR